MDYGSLVPLRRSTEALTRQPSLFVLVDPVFEKGFNPIQELFDLIKSGTYDVDVRYQELLKAVNPLGATALVRPPSRTTPVPGAEPSPKPEGAAPDLSHPKYEMAASRALMHHHMNNYRGQQGTPEGAQSYKKYVQAATRLNQLESQHGSIDTSDVHEQLMNTAHEHIHAARGARSEGKPIPEHGQPEHIAQGESSGARARAHASYLQQIGEGHRTGETDLPATAPGKPGSSRLFQVVGGKLQPTSQVGQLEASPGYKEAKQRGTVAGTRGLTAAPSELQRQPTPTPTSVPMPAAPGTPGVEATSLIRKPKLQRSIFILDTMLKASAPRLFVTV